MKLDLNEALDRLKKAGASVSLNEAYEEEDKRKQGIGPLEPRRCGPESTEEHQGSVYHDGIEHDTLIA
jgi:hypothetical protein